jgi:4-hydroxybenzoyl-CoA thioesterase
MKFTTVKKVRFHHCDPAGIVFYPQFYYLLHEVQEDFLAHIGFAEHTMIEGGAGVPIVDMKTEFLGMCRYGDELTMTLALTRVGNTSLGMHYEIYGSPQATGEAGAIKLRADAVVVYAKFPSGKAMPFPDDLREALQPYIQRVAEKS